MSGLVHAEIERQVGRLRFRRSDKRNALNEAMVNEALAAMDDFVAAGIRVAVLEADPPVFCAGNDLSEVPLQVEKSVSLRFIDALLDRPLFWVAAVSGPALGAGVAAVAVCPVTVAVETSWFALPEREIGLFPAGVLPYLEPVMGTRAAFRFGLTGVRLSAHDAVAAGLVDEVVGSEHLKQRVQDRLDELLLPPGVTDAARQAWQGTFRTPAFADRLEQMLRVLGKHERWTPSMRGDT